MPFTVFVYSIIFTPSLTVTLYTLRWSIKPSESCNFELDLTLTHAQVRQKVKI